MLNNDRKTLSLPVPTQWLALHPTQVITFYPPEQGPRGNSLSNPHPRWSLTWYLMTQNDLLQSGSLSNHHKNRQIQLVVGSALPPRTPTTTRTEGQCSSPTPSSKVANYWRTGDNTVVHPLLHSGQLLENRTMQLSNPLPRWPTTREQGQCSCPTLFQGDQLNVSTWILVMNWLSNSHTHMRSQKRNLYIVDRPLA